MFKFVPMANKELTLFLESLLSENRKARIEKVLEERTNFLTVAIQDVYQLHNTSAVLRSCDVFGIQNLHVIEERNRKKIDREIAMGAQKWVDVHRYTTTKECVDLLKRDYRIVATCPNRGIPFQEYELQEPAALFFGTEKEGLSDEIIDQADTLVHIPMFGFTQSLNISVAAAIMLQEFTFRMRKEHLPWRLSQEDKEQKKLEWVKKNFKNVQQLIDQFYASH